MRTITPGPLKLGFFWLVSALCLLAGCGSEEPASKVDLSLRETPRMQQNAGDITYAYLPQYSHTVSYQKHRRLVDYLRAATGLNIRQIFPDNFGKHMKMVGQCKIDLSFTNPYFYVRMADRYGSSAFARIVEKRGGARYRGQVICRADNQRIRTLDDCRGKRWIAVDPVSAGGFLCSPGHVSRPWDQHPGLLGDQLRSRSGRSAGKGGSGRVRR